MAGNPFVYLAQSEWAQLLQHAELLTFGPGQLLYEKGCMPNGMLVIVKGAARIAFGAGNVSVQAGIGSVLGELSLIDPKPAQVDVKTVEETQFFYIKHSDVRRLVESIPSIEGRFYKSLLHLVVSRTEQTLAALP